MRALRLVLGSFALAAASFCILPGQAAAQYSDIAGIQFNNPISSTMSTMIWGKINEAAIKEAQRRQSGRSSSRNNTPSSRRGNSSTSTTSGIATPPSYGPVVEDTRITSPQNYPSVRFRPTGTRLVFDEYLNSVKVGEKEKNELKYLIPAMWTVYEEEAVAKGLPNDVALAFVSFIVINAHVYAGSREKLTSSFGQDVTLRNQLAEQTTLAGTFRNSTDRQKQELYEVLTLFGCLTFHYYLKAVKENDQATLQELKKAAATQLKLLGIEP